MCYTGTVRENLGRMTITTHLIEKLCLQEETQWPDAEWKQERLQWLKQELDAGRYGNIERDFSHIGYETVSHGDRLQLCCEAIKFHKLRLAGHGLHDSLDRMI